MPRHAKRSSSCCSSCLLWPFVILWRLLTGLLGLGVRFIVVLLGLVFIFVGLLVSLTIVGAIVGIPLALLGLLMVFWGLT